MRTILVWRRLRICVLQLQQCAAHHRRTPSSPPHLSCLVQLGMAQRMAQLYREAKEERATKCTELEGVVQELKAHMEVQHRAGR